MRINKFIVNIKISSPTSNVKLKRNTYSLKLEQAKSNLKETWKIIKTLINKNKNQNTLPDSFKYNNTSITNTEDISNRFNEYFVGIGPALDNKIEKSRLDLLGDSFFMKPTTSEEISQIIRSCKNKLSSGCDNISMAIIKHTEGCIAMPLAYICNLSIVNAYVPSGMKIAKVTPIFKSDAPDEFSNYRPISLLPNFSKILEKLIFNRMVDFLDKYNYILYENQYGFRPNYSTEHALIQLSDKIARAIDDKKFMVGIFVDLSKAFDTLNPQTPKVFRQPKTPKGGGG